MAGYGCCGAEQEANGLGEGSPAVPQTPATCPAPLGGCGAVATAGCGQPCWMCQPKILGEAGTGCLGRCSGASTPRPQRVAKRSGTEASGARGGAAGRGVCCWSFTPEPASAGERLRACKRLKLCPCVYFSWLPRCIITCQHFRWGFICALKIAWGGRMQTLCSMLENVPPA